MKSYTLAALSAIAMVAVAGCDAKDPLSVRDPDVAVPSTLTGKGSLSTLHAGTLADFAVSFSGAADVNNGGHEGIANFGALFTDEMIDIETFPTRLVMNQRIALPSNSSLAGVFQNLGSVHNDAERAFVQFKLYGPTQANYAEIYALDAYVYIHVAEHWCSGMPFSTIDVATGAVHNGAFLTTAQMLDTALAELQLAKTIVASDTVSGDADQIANVMGLAQVGAARALLDLGDVAAAADSAASVPAGFDYQILESTNTLRQSNGVWFYNVNFPSFGEADLKNGTGQPFVSSNDPRTAAFQGAAAGGQSTPFFVSKKYPLPNSPMTLANYTEAQLIVAEGDVFAGKYGLALGIMQALRAGSKLTFGVDTGVALPDLTAGTPKQQQLQVLQERAFWMWVTGHRLGDWRRMLRAPYNTAPYSFVTGDVYPVSSGISNTLEFPTPLLTNPNPNFKACDPTIP